MALAGATAVPEVLVGARLVVRLRRKRWASLMVGQGRSVSALWSSGSSGNSRSRIVEDSARPRAEIFNISMHCLHHATASKFCSFKEYARTN